MDEVLNNAKWLGHDGFLFSAAGKTVVVDPFKVENGQIADVILVTHEHFDHCSPDDIAKFSGKDTVIVTDADSAKKLSGNVKVVAPGDTVTANGVKVTAVPAYNTDKLFHPKDKGWLGFVFTLSGVSIYHAGDTDLIPEMADINADIALLPVSGTYVMTAEEAVQAAKRIKPRVAVPMHYGSIVGDEKDAETFKQALEGEMRVKVFK
ncbi:MAG: MBL fold metallo-hydrolase [Deltaproteobacteria bacterium]|nr:MBL fold metallo-hydrolase [Deltaproteobacteria bacterium]